MEPSTHQFNQALAYRLRVSGVRANHQNGIVTGDCAHNFRPLFVVQRHCYGTGMPRRGAQHDLVLRLPHIAQKLAAKRRKVRRSWETGSFKS